MQRRIGTLLLAGALFAPIFASAQFLGADPLTLSVSPQYPHPYDRVTITPGSTLINLGASTVTYTVNGKAGGTVGGGSSFSVQAGAAGSVTTVAVTATGPDGTYQKTLTLAPSDVELIAEPQTTAHPLYPGGRLTASQSTVRLVALADLRTSKGAIDSKSLVYDWKLGDQQLIPQSGLGRSVLMVTAPERYRSATVSVTVSSQDGSVNGHAALDLSPAEPLLRVYENDPLLGPRYDRALSGTFSMRDNEASFVAVPYFFSKAPVVSWAVGGSAAGQGPVVTVKSAGSGEGNASLAANAVGATALESAAMNLFVSFTGPQASGGFGSLFGL
jgi:hypothetical protein